MNSTLEQAIADTKATQARQIELWGATVDTLVADKAAEWGVSYAELAEALTEWPDAAHVL